jgi:hypothetical protein
MSVPELRRRLIALRQDIYDRFTYDEEGTKLLGDPSTTAVPWPVPTEWRGKKELSRLGQSGENKVFVRNPFDDDTYVVIEEAMSHFALAKYRALAELCGMLGAKVLTARELRESDGTTSYTRVLGGATPLVAARGRYGTELGERVSQSIEATWKYQHNKIDIEAAERLLTEKGLDSDPMIRSMVSLRAQGKLAQQTWTVNLTNEGSREVTFAAELKALLPISALSQLSGELYFQREYSARNRLEVKIDVKF